MTGSLDLPYEVRKIVYTNVLESIIAGQYQSSGPRYHVQKRKRLQPTRAWTFRMARPRVACCPSPRHRILDVSSSNLPGSAQRSLRIRLESIRLQTRAMLAQLLLLRSDLLVDIQGHYHVMRYNYSHYHSSYNAHTLVCSGVVELLTTNYAISRAKAIDRQRKKVESDCLDPDYYIHMTLGLRSSTHYEKIRCCFDHKIQNHLRKINLPGLKMTTRCASPDSDDRALLLNSNINDDRCVTRDLLSLCEAKIIRTCSKNPPVVLWNPMSKTVVPRTCIAFDKVLSSVFKALRELDGENGVWSDEQVVLDEGSKSLASQFLRGFQQKDLQTYSLLLFSNLHSLVWCVPTNPPIPSFGVVMRANTLGNLFRQCRLDRDHRYIRLLMWPETHSSPGQLKVLAMALKSAKRLPLPDDMEVRSRTMLFTSDQVITSGPLVLELGTTIGLSKISVRRSSYFRRIASGVGE
ncbi:hypothetical protein KCV07_g400, partial [Aureobasidium melanogenum]